MFIRIALDLGLRVHALRPCFLHHCATRPGDRLVERADAGEVDLGVYMVLEGRCEVVGVVVSAVIVVVRMGVFIVAMVM